MFEVTTSAGIETASNIGEAVTQFQILVESGDLLFNVKDSNTGKTYQVDATTWEVEDV